MVKLNFLEIQSETTEEFNRIAKILFNDYAIGNREYLFRLTKIEFYWHSDKHGDKSTYPRKHADPNTGEWFFHYSGADIALKSEKFNGHGGILIRAVYDLNSGKK
jgi:hypothetical protein